MKNQILDELTRDSFSDFLEKGEKIIWVGKPNLTMESTWKNKLGKISFIIFSILILLEAFLYNKILLAWVKLFFLLLFTFTLYRIYYAKKKDVEQIQYAITSKNIIFKLTNLDFRKLPLTSILNIKVIRNENHLPSIELVVKEGARFETYILHDNKNRFVTKRKTPTLEHIENTEEIIQLINQLTRPHN